MSRSIEIKVSDSETRTIHVEDGIQTHLSILSVSSKEEMISTLADEIEKKGFAKGEDGVHRRVDGEVTTEIDTATQNVTVKISSGETVTKKASRLIRGYDDTLSQNDRHADAARKDLAGIIAKEFKEEEKVIQQRLTDALEKHLESLKTELDDTVNNVVKRNLRSKAASMGDIQEISEDADGNMTIKVSV